MTDKTLADALRSALNEEDGPKITYRSVDTYNWDAYFAAEQKFLAAHAPKQSWELRDHPDRPDYTRDFKHPKPIVHEKVYGKAVDGGEDWEEEPIGYDQFKEILDSSGDEGVTIEGLGTAYIVSEHGGEGQGDSYWYVFKLVIGGEVPQDAPYEERFFKVDGYYASYSGGYYDELYEVFPKKVEVTEWTQG